MLIQRERFGADIVVFDAKTDYFPLILRHDGIKSWFFFDSTRVKYISVLRRNLLAQILSRYRAAHTNVWSVLDPDASQCMRDKFLRLGADKGLPEPVSLGDGITVDPETIYSEVEHLARSNAATLDFLGDRIDLQLWFEELFDHDGQFSPEIVDRLGDVCCIDPQAFNRKPSLLRQSSDSLLHGVANPDALIARFASTPFEWMLRR